MSIEPTNAQPVAWIIQGAGRGGGEHLARCSPSADLIASGVIASCMPVYAHPPADAALPCDVMIAPATMFSRGVPLHTLLDAMARRRGMPDPETRFRPQSRAALAEQVRVLREALEELVYAGRIYSGETISRAVNLGRDALAATAPDGEAQ